MRYQVLADNKRSGKVLSEDYRTKEEANARKRELEREGKYINVRVWDTRHNPLSNLLTF